MEIPVSARAALLHVLTAGPGYGYSLIERVRERSGGRIELAEPNVYVALRVMRAAGLIEIVPSEEDGRVGKPRRYYRLTEAGIAAELESSEAVRALFRDG